MTINKRGYQVPDAYTACVLLIAYDRDEHVFKLIMSRQGAVDKEGHSDSFDGLWAIPEKYVEYGQMANETAQQIIHEQLKLDIPSMFVRHIAVFDGHNRDTRGWYIVNVFYAAVDYQLIKRVVKLRDYTIISEKQLTANPTQIAFDHYAISQKVIKNLKNDVYTQIFNKALFESDVISELLGKQFSAKDLYSLGQSVGLKYERTTYYRNINKFYKKVSSIKVDGIKKPVTLYQKETILNK